MLLSLLLEHLFCSTAINKDVIFVTVALIYITVQNDQSLCDFIELFPKHFHITHGGFKDGGEKILLQFSSFFFFI